MNFQEHIQYLTETEEMTFRIGYGVRDAKTHKLIKFFNNLKFYQELKQFKTDEENAKNLEQKKWKITNELQDKDLRFFEFWGDSERFPITKDEPNHTIFKKGI